MHLGLADHESALRFSCYLKLFGFSISLDHYPFYQKIRDAIKRKDEQYGNGRMIGWSWYDGCYPATVRFFESTWKRPRWPWSKKIVRADIYPDTPIPYPGKGENSWDCDEDATHSMMTAEETELGAVVAMVESVLRSRYRHGGLSWRPKLKVVQRG